MKKSSMPTRGLNKLSIVILGPGAIGGLLAAIFWKAGFLVTCVAKSSEFGLLSKEGIRVRSKIFGNFTAWPKIVSKLDSKPDILFVATKAGSLSGALQSIPRRMSPKMVIPLLNGIEHIKTLREFFGKKIAVGMIGRIEVKKDKVNLILHSSSISPRLEIASDKDIPRKSLQKIAKVLSKTGIEMAVLDSEAKVIWRKLVRLNALACITAVTSKPLGFARKNKKWKKKLENCVKEGVLVARDEGVDLDTAEIMEQINSLPIGLTTSLQRDIASKLDSELENIIGAVLRRARHHHLKCPTINDIYQKLLKKVSKARQNPIKRR